MLVSTQRELELFPQPEANSAPLEMIRKQQGPGAAFTLACSSSGLAAQKIAARAKKPNLDPAIASQGQPGADALDLLVEVGGYANRLRVAGVACEKAYDAVSSKN